ncbi:PepSY-associated TM helix domain-containing protein [Aurantiacibacter suaedae]|uniref:PepSY-associated TM helix domain-containing protein n=1 Tax=Aurantiacibacter suaedae TaxID=2545755 RepID=UPI001F4F3023|nr:PepSY-associated TM helix domain-containing protein [Aurantiacibacter suaedae]
MNQQNKVVAAKKSANGRFVSRMIESHSILGLVFAALIYVVSLTGAFTVFADEIAVWENSSAPTAEAATPQAYQTALEAAFAKRVPNGQVQNVVAYGPSEFAPAVMVRLNQRDADNRFITTDWMADPASGELLGEAASPLSHLIEELHVALHLPGPWGRYLVGLLGVCMFSLVLSGILAHPSIVRDAFKLRIDRNRRIAWTDMHNRLSVWGLPFHLVLTFTGGFLGLAGLIVGAVAMVAYDGDQERALASIQGLQPVEGRTLDGFPPIAKMVTEARERGKPIDFVLVNQPANAGGVTQIRLSDDATLDGRRALMFRNAGEFVESYGGEGAPGGIRALAMVSPLHFGTFGGYPVKAFYLVMALALTWVTSSGMKIWFARREQQGRPVPRLRAAWCGMTAGLTAGLALATLTATLDFGAAVVPVCLAVWLLALGAFVARPKTVKADYRIVLAQSAIALILAFAASVAGHGMGTGIALAVNLSLLLLGGALGAFAARDATGARRAHERQLPA